jgi:hypothetical protein
MGPYIQWTCNVSQEYLSLSLLTGPDVMRNVYTKLLERFADTDAPSMAILTSSEVRAKIHMILLAQFKPGTTAAAGQEVLGPKWLIAAGYYPSKPSKPRDAKPLG